MYVCLRFGSVRFGSVQLETRYCPANIVAIYDDYDNHGAKVAGTPQFQNAASDFEHSYGGHSIMLITEKLANHVKVHGKIDTLYIFDHGLYVDHDNDKTTPAVPAGKQTFGDTVLTPGHFALLQPFLVDGAVVVFGGCGVGTGQEYCNDAATALGNNITI
jgi:hypothetical protein